MLAASFVTCNYRPQFNKITSCNNILETPEIALDMGTISLCQLLNQLKSHFLHRQVCERQLQYCAVKIVKIALMLSLLQNKGWSESKAGVKRHELTGLYQH